MIKLNKNILLASVFAVAMGSFVGTAQAVAPAQTGGAASAATATATATATQTKFTVVMKSGVTASNKISTIKAVRELNNMGLKEAKDLVDDVSDGKSQVVKASVDKEAADTFKADLEKLGVVVELQAAAGATEEGTGAGGAGAGGAGAGGAGAGGAGAGANQTAAGAGSGAKATAASEGATCNDPKVKECATGTDCTWQKPASADAAAKKAPLEEQTMGTANPGAVK